MGTIARAGTAKFRTGAWVAALYFLLAAAASAAIPLTVASYDLINGGTTSPSTSVRDDTYVGGTGNPSIAYSPLAGGKGDLTDGITSPQNWDSNPAPYVGWSEFNLASPVITFHFAQTWQVTQVTLYVNWQYSPGSVDFSTDGITWVPGAYTLPLPPTANALVTISNLNLTGNTILVRLNNRANDSYPDNIVRSADWIMVQEITFFGGPPPVLDIDASDVDTRYDALTDGLLTLRYLFGLTGTSLTHGALGGTAARDTPEAVAAYLDSIRTAIDVDGDGNTDALSDGLLIIRYLFGLRGDSLIHGAVSVGATRTTAPEIEAYILSLMP